MVGILAELYFLRVYGPRRSRGPSTRKKERGQYPAISTKQAWSIKYSLYGLRRKFSCGMRRVVPSGQDSSIRLSAWSKETFLQQNGNHLKTPRTLKCETLRKHRETIESQENHLEHRLEAICTTPTFPESFLVQNDSVSHVLQMLKKTVYRTEKVIRNQN